MKENKPKANALLALTIAVILVVTLFTASLFARQKPNILLIQADDLGYDDINNPHIETPHLDQLGRGSVQLDQFYLQSLCAPSRAAMLTGRNYLRTGVSYVHGGRDFIHPDETLLPQVLQNNGYVTGMWGKWHSGKTNGYFPWDRGFDEAYYASLYNYFDSSGLMNGEELETDGFTTDAITDLAIDFIKRNKDHPFFAYMAHLAPHNPWRAPEAYEAIYRAKGLSEPVSKLYGMITNLDDNIGRLLATLEDLGIANNTVVIFISDNGPWISSYRFGMTEEEWELRNPSGMRGMKGQIWENGIRSRFFVRWPGHFEPAVIRQPAIIEDIFPTILSIAGIAIPGTLELDGVDLKSLINQSEPMKTAGRIIVTGSPALVGGESFQNELDPNGYYVPFTDDFRESVVFENQPFAVRKGDYKFVQNQIPGEKHLFNLAKDPREENNIIGQEPEIAKELEQCLREWWSGIVHSKHALTTPELQIGLNGQTFNPIYAVMMHEHSANVMNTDHFVGNWNEAGDYSSYKIKVHEPGDYQVFLIHEIDNYEDLEFSVAAGNSKSSRHLSDTGDRDFGVLINHESAYWENFDYKDTFKESIVKSDLGTISLTTDMERLDLRLENIRDGHPDSSNARVIAIHLMKQ